MSFASLGGRPASRFVAVHVVTGGDLTGCAQAGSVVERMADQPKRKIARDDRERLTRSFELPRRGMIDGQSAIADRWFTPFPLLPRAPVDPSHPPAPRIPPSIDPAEPPAPEAISVRPIERGPPKSSQRPHAAVRRPVRTSRCSRAGFCLPLTSSTRRSVSAVAAFNRYHAATVARCPGRVPCT
jgi:hypothetical protein